jgi:hypothetical protein
LIKRLEEENPERTIAVLIPELVKTHWWQYLLHGGRARRLLSVLEYGGSGVVAIVVPWYLQEPNIEEAMSEEERGSPLVRARSQRRAGNGAAETGLENPSGKGAR